MAAVQNVGIVGAGAAGLTAAILLADAGIRVEVLEKADAPQTLGSGITLQGNALRILRQLGVWEQIEAKGYPSSTSRLRAPDPAGTVIAVLEDIRTGGDDLPATLGMYRPDLTAILRERAEQAGARISYGKAVTEIADDGDSVTVSTGDGSTARYDLLIGADGLHSAVRKGIGIDVEPAPTGMGIWRAFVEQPEDVVRTDLTYGGPCFIAGYCPTGPDTIYAYLVERAQERKHEDGPRIMAELAAAYRRSLERYSREPGPQRPHQLHVVHHPPHEAALEPRPHGHHRRRRPQLPAHGGTGRCHGPRRRRRAG